MSTARFWVWMVPVFFFVPRSGNMTPITVAEFLREVGLPPRFKRVERFYDTTSRHVHCGDAQFTTSSAAYLRSVYVPHDRITHVPASGKQVVIGFKEYLYRYLVHPSFVVLNATEYEWALNLHFITCPIRRRRVIRFVLPPRPTWKTPDGQWRTTAREIHFLLNSGVAFQLYRLDTRKSLQYLVVPTP